MLLFKYDFLKLTQFLVVGWMVFRLARAFLQGKPHPIRAILIWGLFLFTLFLLYRTFEPFVFAPDRQALKVNLVPLRGIMSMIENASKFDDQTTQRIVFVNIVGNILIFSPFGYLFPILEKRLRKFWLVVLIAFGISLAIELTQASMAVRVFDVDDLILNSFGAWIGYAFYWVSAQVGAIGKAYEALAEASRPKAFLFLLLYLAFSFLVALGLFYYDYSAFRLIPQG